VTLTDWPGNFTLPDERVRFQMSVPRYQEARDVSWVLVTRFWMGADPPAEGFDARLDLFESYLLPSIYSQTRRPDLWLILTSERWADLWLSHDLVPWVRFVRTPGPGSEGSSIASGIRTGLEGVPLQDRVVVSRCDGDDALAEDYGEALTKYISAAGFSGPCYLNFTQGVQYDTRSGEARLDVRTEGHFGAVVQPSSQRIIGPYAHAHVEVWKQQEYPAISILTRQPMWCEIVGDHNAINRMRQGPTLADGWKDRFHVS
jgi:hypothetical protein